MDKKLLIPTGIFVVLVIAGAVYFFFSSFNITPTDTKIVRILDQNEKNLLSIDGLVGGGIARDGNNSIIGIAVYVEDDITDADRQKIPSNLGEFEVFIKRISEASEFERENMIIKKLLIVKQSGGAGLLTAECANKSYITETADYIIEGTVEKVESKWNEERTSIFTYTNLMIEKYIKGTPFKEKKFQIVTPGGTVGEISQWVEDQPIFHEGKKVRVYLQKKNGEFSIVCAQFGVEEL